MSLYRSKTVELELTANVTQVLGQIDAEDCVAHFGSELLEHFTSKQMLEEIDEDDAMKHFGWETSGE